MSSDEAVEAVETTDLDIQTLDRSLLERLKQASSRVSVAVLIHDGDGVSHRVHEVNIKDLTVMDLLDFGSHLNRALKPWRQT